MSRPNVNANELSASSRVPGSPGGACPFEAVANNSRVFLHKLRVRLQQRLCKIHSLESPASLKRGETLPRPRIARNCRFSRHVARDCRYFQLRKLFWVWFFVKRCFYFGILVHASCFLTSRTFVYFKKINTALLTIDETHEVHARFTYWISQRVLHFRYFMHFSPLLFLKIISPLHKARF